MSATPPASWAALATSLGPAVIGLLGVLVGGGIQAISSFWMARQQRKDRLKDEEAARGRETAKTEAGRSYVRALLARHLEAYARSCAKVMWANDDPEEEGAMMPPEFPAWPPDTAWELLAPDEMMLIRDIEVRVDIQRQQVEGVFRVAAAAEREARSYFMDGAARIGLDAWKAAQGLRVKAGVAPFKFPRDDGGFAQSLAEHVDRLDEQALQSEERRAAKLAAQKAARDD